MNWGISFSNDTLRRGWRTACAGLICALAALMIAPAALAQSGSSAPASTPAHVTVVTPASLVKINDLDFGSIVPQTTAGTVILNPANNACTTTGAIIHIGGCLAANFAGMGRRNFIVRLSVSTSTNLTGPGQTMIMNAMTIDTAPDLVFQPNGNGNGAGNQRYRIDSNTGIFNFQVGGTLRVNANQVPGPYAGTFTVTANYQ